jgi:hypothetical protein
MSGFWFFGCWTRLSDSWIVWFLCRKIGFGLVFWIWRILFWRLDLVWFLELEVLLRKLDLVWFFWICCSFDQQYKDTLPLAFAQEQNNPFIGIQ